MPTNSEFDAVMFGGSNSVVRGEGKMGRDLGDSYGQETGEVPTRTPADTYPNVSNSTGMDENNRMFSRDKNWEPQAMADEASGSAFYELQHFLNNSPYTAGSRVCHELDEKGVPAHPSGGKAGPGNGRTGPA